MTAPEVAVTAAPSPSLPSTLGQDALDRAARGERLDAHYMGILRADHARARAAP